jgi:hypothetical protein
MQSDKEKRKYTDNKIKAQKEKEKYNIPKI